MDLAFNPELAVGYTSKTQIARRLTEGWVEGHVFCLNCGNTKVEKHPNNEKAKDFFCLQCNENFELKSSNRPFGDKITGAAYSAMIERINSGTNSNFFLLEYKDSQVMNFMVIPKHYFTAEIVKKRNPAHVKGRKSEWVGCMIHIAHVPASGRIYYVRDGIVVPRDEVLKQWQKTLFLRAELESTSKGWLLDVMGYVDSIQQEQFTLADMYKFEDQLARLHPQNRHVKDKIRQQLQKLRDHEYIEFVASGRYRKINTL